MTSALASHLHANRLAVGLLVGGAIAAVDNFAFGGEVSPIVIVAMLLTATAYSGALLGPASWLASLSTWVCVPAAHFVKRLLALPDTLHPNTWASLFALAAFTFAVSAVGTLLGLAFHSVRTTPRTPSRPA